MSRTFIKKALFTLLLSIILFPSCAPNEEGMESENFSLVPPGKADNFYSDSAMEFLVSGSMLVELAEEHLDLPADEQRDRAEELAQLKVTMLMAYLNEYVIDKSDHSSQADYGGLHAMARAASFESETLTEESPGVYRFSFTGEIGGSLDFMDLVPASPNYTAPLGGKVLEFGVPLLSTTDLQNGLWQSSYAISPSSWDPATKDPSVVEVVPLTITPEEISKDAFIDYNALMADGLLTVGIHFGYDYNEQQYDLQEAREVYDKLVVWGFASPAPSFEALTLTSGPFVKTVTANGRSVRVEITLIHDQMVDPVSDAALLKAALIESFTTREVILFNGHAGFSGRFLPANWQSTSAGNISSEEMWAMNLPSWYQVVLVNGCDTYGKFADNFRLNPAKQDAQGNLINVDVVTSTSFAWLSQMGNVSLKFVQSLCGGYQNEVTPITWDRLLTEINWGVNSSVFFGVHGIDDNPRLHPFADPAAQCRPCAATSDCGSPLGQKCVAMLDGAKYCAMTCLDDSACPVSMTCQNVAKEASIVSRHCVPVSLTCTSDAH
ncbi:hypothetical protein KKF84_06930, partial [Myxococcota bacterium]|nr:hypothetical protein [Myxococcota bacterium]